MEAIESRINNLGGNLPTAKNETKKRTQRRFMETEKGSDAVVEGIISLWRISKGGQLVKEKEVNLEYDMKYKQTRGQNLKLQLSYDKTVVSLALIDNRNFQMLAWKTKNLATFELPQELHDNLEKIHNRTSAPNV